MAKVKDRDGGSRHSSGRKRGRGRKQAAPPVRSARGLVPVDRNGHAYEFIENQFAEKGRVAVPLTRSEIRILAQHHWDAGYGIASYIAANVGHGSSDLRRMYYYDGRCMELVDQLPEQDQKQFEQMCEERNAHLEALAAEAEDCDC